MTYVKNGIVYNYAKYIKLCEIYNISLFFKYLLILRFKQKGKHKLALHYTNVINLQ